MIDVQESCYFTNEFFQRVIQHCEDEGLGDSRAEDEGGAFENDEEMEEFMRQGGGVEYILKSDEEFGEDEDDAGKLEENKVEDEDRAEVVSPLAPQKSVGWILRKELLTQREGKLLLSRRKA